MKLVAAVVSAAAAMMVASQSAAQYPPDLVNRRPINPVSWIYGPLYKAPAGNPIWNPAKVKMNNGTRTIGGTVSNFSLTGYCNTASTTGNNGSDFTWTEMQHSNLDWTQAWAMWNQPCSHTAITVPGARIAYTHKREIRKALDGGVMVLVVPTVDSVQEAKDIVQMAYYPPIGQRKYGPGQYQSMYANVPGGYRETFNDNLVVIVMIETILGSQAAFDIANVPGVHGVFGATSDLGNFSGFVNGNPDYDRLIKNAHDAALAGGKRACSALGFQSRPGFSFSCFQN